MAKRVIAIDAGTTGIRVNAYDVGVAITDTAYREFTQHYPAPGWVEHDADEIWEVTRALLLEVVGAVGGWEEVAGIGITNQRETCLVWDRESGRPLYRAIVWQDRRTKELCEAHRATGHEPMVRRRTGLLLDAYFSGTKLEWLMKNVAELGDRAAKEPGSLCFGTVDTWLAYKLSGGRVHVTDPTNASRTLLYDLDERRFHPELLELLGVPMAMLPEVVGSAEVYGETEEALLGGPVKLCGLVGDQQAALFGQGCVTPGSSKNTYGTGCFALVNCGAERPPEPEGLLTTLACDAHADPVYALEGSVFIAGAAIQWLRDGLKLVATAKDSEALALSVPDTGGVYFVPAFVGLGAPYWDMEARGALLGLTRGTGIAHIVRAALEAICYESRDLLDALERASGAAIDALRMDGGASANAFLAQFQADVLGKVCLRPADAETTARGAALLAGLGTGFWSDFAEIATILDEGTTRFEPAVSESEREKLYGGWKAAVGRVLTKGGPSVST